MDVEYISQIEGQDKLQCQIRKQVEIGNIPIMLGCSHCVLLNNTNEELA